MTHTPGPWTWFNYPDGRKLLCAEDRAVIHCPDAPISIELADAHLIAAAPDLLDVARQTAECFTQSTVFGAVVRAAIAKAEGR
jgi:hypothetical protein